MDQYNAGKKGLLINPTAVSEFVYEFVRMYSQLSTWCHPPIVRAHYRLGIFQANEPAALCLSEGRPGPFFGFQGRLAPNNEPMGMVGPVELPEGDTGSQEVTVLILRRFYELFGWGREAIPHLTDDGERFDPGSLNRQ